jgi:DNA-binding protein YbaB
MNPDTFDPQRLLDQLEARIAKAKENAAALSAVQGWGEAANGYVKVCVGPSAVLQRVELDPRAMRLPSQDLAASIVAAAREGQQAAAATIREIYATSDNNGGIDVASIAQGEYDVSQYIDERLENARAVLRNARY